VAIKDIEVQYAKEFWSLANAITAFAITQTLVFVSTVGTRRGDLAEAIHGSPKFTAACAVVSFALYLSGIAYCQRRHRGLLGPFESTGLESSFRRMEIGRHVIAVACGIFTLTIIIADA